MAQGLDPKDFFPHQKRNTTSTPMRVRVDGEMHRFMQRVVQQRWFPDLESYGDLIRDCIAHRLPQYAEMHGDPNIIADMQMLEQDADLKEYNDREAGLEADLDLYRGLLKKLSHNNEVDRLKKLSATLKSKRRYASDPLRWQMLKLQEEVDKEILYLNRRNWETGRDEDGN